MEKTDGATTLGKSSNTESPSLDSSPATGQKTSSSGVTLIPQPSDNPKDPLNWPLTKKIIILVIWCLGAFISTGSGLGNALGYFVQAKVYHKDDPIALSYSVVAATAGIAVGPLFAVPLSRRYGRASVFFWSMVGLLATGIWSATMTRSDQYIAFVMARLFGGLFGGTAPALGANTVVDMFYLHQRGKGLTLLNLSFLSGVVVGPTLSGFIVGSVDWPVQFWWSNGVEAAIIILSLLFLEETFYDRTTGREPRGKTQPLSFIARRWTTFFRGSKLMPPISFKESVRHFLVSIQIGICPVTILAGGLTLIDFGFAAFFNIVLTVFLQNPLEKGGYAFTPTRNAEFLFSLWFGIIAAQLYGHFINDRIPLWVCRRNGGIWQPEYRLHSLWLPGLIILPISLGLFGAALEYHLHYMVLALACFLGGYATNSLIPVTVNYVIECFKNHASESAAIMGLYRLAFSLSLPFFVPAWIDRVGFGWCLGMAAFFSIFAFGSVVLLIWKGHKIREYSFKDLASSEGGVQIVQGNEKTFDAA